MDTDSDESEDAAPAQCAGCEHTKHIGTDCGVCGHKHRAPTEKRPAPRPPLRTTPGPPMAQPPRAAQPPAEVVNGSPPPEDDQEQRDADFWAWEQEQERIEAIHEKWRRNLAENRQPDDTWPGCRFKRQRRCDCSTKPGHCYCEKCGGGCFAVMA